jgi:hypothetical protein
MADRPNDCACRKTTNGSTAIAAAAAAPPVADADDDADDNVLAIVPLLLMLLVVDIDRRCWSDANAAARILACTADRERCFCATCSHTLLGMVGKALRLRA